MIGNAQAESNREKRTESKNRAETKLFADILKQPAQLASSLSHICMSGAGKGALDAAAAVVRGAKSVVIAGIGASWHAGMAMQAEFLAAGIPALLIDASELLHCAELPESATVILLSRSGKSTEIVQLVQKCRARSASIIAITNQADSALAQGSDIVLNTSTDFDHAVSVVTYSAIAQAGVLLALEATGRSAYPIPAELMQSLSVAAALIPRWRSNIEQSGWLGGGNEPTYFIARGASLASCHEARLLWEEAAKKPATALTTGGFRHGPQEIIRKGLRVGIWIDEQHMRAQDLDLARDMKKLGASTLLIGQGLEESAGDCVLCLPAIPARWQFLIDIIPIQIAVEGLAALRGEDPDSFRFCSYIVEDEGGLIPHSQ
jgi:glucosamine--fructose-6-phosphate aminotransferase (isomerizing)